MQQILSYINSRLQPNQKNCIIICGPTASGKTELAIQLAQYFNTSIISADSRQCFKELNIGVAKPSAEELITVYHYFINSHSIQDEVTAVTFEQYALNAAKQIFLQNDIAVMAGGTGLYIKAFTEGLDAIPEVSAEVRTSIQQQYEEDGIEWLQNEIKKHDPAFFSSGEMQNPQRLMRALEVFSATGKSITKFQIASKKERPFNIIKIGLEVNREILYNRINQRVDAMIQHGLEFEAEALLPHRNLNALQTVGYTEWFDYFDGNTSKEKAINLIKQNTRHYAKRQLTWFKRDKEIEWFDVSGS